MFMDCKCLFMYLSTPLDTHIWRLLYKQIMNDNTVKHSCNNIKYVFIGEVIIADIVH